MHTTKTNNEELSGKLAHTQTSCYGPHNVGRKHNDDKKLFTRNRLNTGLNYHNTIAKMTHTALIPVLRDIKSI